MSNTKQVHDEFNLPKIKLMQSRKFAPLFWTQFFAAFNDNFLKNTLVLLILATVATKEEQGALTVLAGAIFMLPFLLLSALGGQLADRFDKAYLAKLLKAAEIGVAVFAAIGLLFSSIWLLMFALFLFGVGSSLFGPIKYAVLPEQIPQHSLPTANAWIEAATFVAILGGTIGAALVFGDVAGSKLFPAALMIIFAVITWLTSNLMPHFGSAQADLKVDKNILRSTWQLVHEIAQERNLFIVALMVSWFWFLGAILVSVMPVLTNLLGHYHQGMAFFMTIFAIAVALGSAIAAWLSAGRIVLLQSVCGTFIFGLFGFDLAFTIEHLPEVANVSSLSEFLALHGVFRISFDIALMAMAGSFLVVPGFAALQAWANPSHRARIIAANNVLNAAIMFGGGILLALFQWQGLSLHAVVLLLSISSIIAAVVMLKFLPTHPIRDFISILFRAFFRLEVKGFEHLNNAGKTPILALNHVSFLDGLLAVSLTEAQHLSPPVFAINSDIARKWWVRPFLKFINAYPLDPSNPLAIRGLIKAVKNGSPLVIFPEGRITVTGSLMKVYDGAAMIADRTNVKVVPIKLDGLERTFFSRLNDMQTKRVLFPKVTVTITPPVQFNLDPALKARARRAAAGAKLYEVMSDLVFKTSTKRSTIFNELINTVNIYGANKPAIEDPIAGHLSYSKSLIAIRALGQVMQSKLAVAPNVGLLMPNSNAAALSFFALQSMAKVPAMLNFSAGLKALQAAIKAAKLHNIVTSRAFLAKAKLGTIASQLEQEGIKFIYLEDLKNEINLWRKIGAVINKKRSLARQIDANKPAVILFTSGSEGAPKGVVLTHQNILSNINQIAARIDFNQADKVFNVLPMFHSFGLVAATILPLVSGVPVYFYPSPLHYRIVPEAIYASNATIIFATDTFLAGYTRFAHPYDFCSIRYCFAGAEPVKTSTRQIMADKFGIRILEGYGITETSPVLALNTPMYSQIGSVGKFLPGIDVKIEPVAGIEQGGRLWVSGPNVMAGYIKDTNPGVIEPPQDGWHDTGDIVAMDAAGFVKIIGRLKRFAKIGGEMISLTAAESLAAKCFPNVMLGVVAIADERKGEALVLVVENESVTRQDLLQFARSAGTPELYVPSKVVYAKIPLLGTGKIDYPALNNCVKSKLS